MPDIGPTSNQAQNNGQAGKTNHDHNWVVHFRAEGNFDPQNHYYAFLRIFTHFKKLLKFVNFYAF